VADATETIVQRVDAFVERARALSDADRVTIAESRRGVEEGFHEKALRSSVAWLQGRAELYGSARKALASMHVPAVLLDDEAEPTAEERERWNEVARLVQLAIDDMLVCLIASDVLHPDHLRELSRPWNAVGAGYAAARTSSTSSP
jgi:hypothetical protein